MEDKEKDSQKKARKKAFEDIVLGYGSTLERTSKRDPYKKPIEQYNRFLYSPTYNGIQKAYEHSKTEELGVNGGSEL